MVSNQEDSFKDILKRGIDSFFGKRVGRVVHINLVIHFRVNDLHWKWTNLHDRSTNRPLLTPCLPFYNFSKHTKQVWCGFWWMFTNSHLHCGVKLLINQAKARFGVFLCNFWPKDVINFLFYERRENLESLYTWLYKWLLCVSTHGRMYGHHVTIKNYSLISDHIL